MLPAEKTHYRKGLALGMTLAETFCVVVFILLLACAGLLLALRNESQDARAELEDAQVELSDAQMERDDAQADLAIAETMLLGGDSSWNNTDAWYEEARRLRRELATAQTRADDAERTLAVAKARGDSAEELLRRGVGSQEIANRVVEQAAQLGVVRDSLRQAEEQLGTQETGRDSAEARLAEAEGIVESIGSQVARHQSLTPAEAASIVDQADRADSLSRALEDTREAVRSSEARRREVERLAAGGPADSLRARLQRSERDRADAVGRAEYREAEIERLTQGRGVDPPPCWMTADRAPQHIFRVELTNRGMRLYRIVNERHANDEAALYADREIEDGREYSPAEFLRLTEPIYRMGRRRIDAFGEDGCRFWIQPVDRTGESKAVFRAREGELWQRFWFRW